MEQTATNNIRGFTKFIFVHGDAIEREIAVATKSADALMLAVLVNEYIGKL
jgi:hypothetical protein